MGISLDSILNTVKLGASVRGEMDAAIRVGVYVDATATPFLIETVRDAFVPQTASALVRVERLGSLPATAKPDTDIAIVLSCGSPVLQARVQELVVCGPPVVVLAESSVEVPFIERDSRMLGLVAATDKVHLLASLARWILERTDKQTAFAANFPFMRIAAANRIIASTSLGNLATGALFFVPGADFPVMTLAQLGMMLRLAAVFGKPLRPERAYEAVAILAAACAMRAGARMASRRVGRLGFVPKALIGGAGTYALGRALAWWYASDVSYDRANRFIRAACTRRHA